VSYGARIDQLVYKLYLPAGRQAASLQRRLRLLINKIYE